MKGLPMKDLPKTELFVPPTVTKTLTKERRSKAHLEDFSISHQLFNRVLGIKSIPTKNLQTKKSQTS